MSKVLFTGLLAGALMAPQAGISAGDRSAPKTNSYLGLLLSPKPHTTTQPVRGAGSEPTPLNSTPLPYGTRFENEHCIHGEIMETVNGLEPG